MKTVLAITLLLAASSARAQNLEPLRHDWAVDGTVTGVGAAAWISSELLKSHLAPSTCRWCATDGFDSSVRDALVWSNPKTADTLSNIGGFGLMPVVALGGVALAGHHDGARGATIASDMLVVSEAVVIAQDLNQLVKFSAGRERPFVHQLPDAQKPLTDKPADNNLSFFSGHTTWAFSLATAAGTVSSMHGYKLSPVVWTVGLTLATATGLLRIGADKHYATDVLVGAAVGSALGIGVPRLLHPVTQPSTGQQVGLSAQPLPGGLALGLNGRF